MLFLVSFLCMIHNFGGAIGSGIHFLMSIISSVVFALLCTLIFSNKASRGILSNCGKYSAQFLYMQNISLYLFHNDLIWVENNYLYAVLTVAIEIILVCLTIPIYRLADNIVHFFNRKWGV